MRPRELAARVSSFAAYAVLGLVHLAALALSPFRIGRVLRAVSLPRLSEHKLRTTLTVLGVALGVAMFLAVVIVNDSLMRGIASSIDDLAGSTDLQVSAGTDGFSESLLETIRAQAGVARAVPLLQQTVTVKDARVRAERLLVLGVDMLEQEDQQFRKYGSAELDAIRKDPLAFLNSPHNLLVSRSFAQRYGYRLHDKLSLATASGVIAFDIWGFLDDDGVGRAFGGAVAVMYYQAMQAAFERQQNLDRVDIGVAPGHTAAAVQAQLTAALGDAFIVEPPARKGDRLGKMLLGVRSGLTIASLIAVLVGAFLIYNTMAISVVQRKREIGILRALGSLRGEITRLLTLEGALLGLVGSVIGLGMGVLLSRGLLAATSTALNEAYVQLPATEVRVAPWVLLAGLALGTLGSTVASIIPGRSAARERPAHTLRTASVMQVEPETRRIRPQDVAAVLLAAASRPLLALPTWLDLPLGAFASAFTLLAAGALLLPRLVQLSSWLLAHISRHLSVEARLAHENLPRDLGRTATTAGALMAGVSLAVAFGTFTYSFSRTLEDWIDQTLPGDLFLTQGASLGGTSMRNIPMADTLFDELRALPGVETVRRVRIVELPFRGSIPKGIASDIDTFLKHAKLSLIEGDQKEVVAGLHNGQLGVSENFARRFGVHKGDHIPISTNKGTRQFRVAGVFIDYTSDVGSVLFDRATYVETFGDTRVDTYELHVRDPKQIEPLRRLINERYAGKLDLFVLTNREFRNEVNHTTEQIFSLVRALELVALVVAVLGIINAQLANVLDRVRELGVLRALGMLRRQVSRMVVVEATLVGALGTLAGVLLGIALGDVMLNHINLVQTGWYFPYRLSWGAIAEVSLLTVPAAALAGLYPARAAARLVVTEALDYE